MVAYKPIESVYKKQLMLTATSLRILNKLKEKAVLIDGKKPSQVPISEFINQSLIVLAEKEGVTID